MKKRGRVLRDVGPGLLMVEGQQYPFSLEGIWKSDVPPKPGMVVEVEFYKEGKIIAIYAVPESQLAKEQAEAEMTVARGKGAALASRMVARFGVPSLIAAGLLIIGWFFLSTVTVQLPFMGKLEFTFWQVLGYLNVNNGLQLLERNGPPSTGFYGFLALVALVGPFVHHLWKDKRAALGGMAPLVFMVIVGLMIRSSIQGAFSGGGSDPAGVARQMQEEAMKAVSLGFGAYISVLVSLYFAAVGAKRFLATKGAETLQFEKSQQAAA
jgi:hypothetical protein